MKRGDSYIGVRAYSTTGSDGYVLVEVAAERMKSFRSDAPDLKRLLIEGSNDGWYLAENITGFE